MMRERSFVARKGCPERKLSATFTSPFRGQRIRYSQRMPQYHLYLYFLIFVVAMIVSCKGRDRYINLFPGHCKF